MLSFAGFSPCRICMNTLQTIKNFLWCWLNFQLLKKIPIQLISFSMIVCPCHLHSFIIVRTPKGYLHSWDEAIFKLYESLFLRISTVNMSWWFCEICVRRGTLNHQKLNKTMLSCCSCFSGSKNLSGVFHYLYLFFTWSSSYI